MNTLQRALRYLNLHFLQLSWPAVLLVTSAHFVISLLLMIWLKEDSLIENWLYFYVTSATTIGYGDLSPQTNEGRFLAAFFIMPGAVVLFAGLIGKLTSFFTNIWRKDMLGKEDYSNLSHHIVILGWHKQNTRRMIDLIFGDTKRAQREVVLCTEEEIENPYPEKIRFIRGNNLKSEDVFQRSGISHADRIIVFRNSDEETLATCLTLASLDIKAHVVAWFNELFMAKLLKKHCPNIECHSSISIELMIRSAQDPGSFRLQEQLLSTLEGPTQYSVKIPDFFSGSMFSRILEYFKTNHDAIALGIADTYTGEDFILNPPNNKPVIAGQLIYYMSDKRINSTEIDWNDI